MEFISIFALLLGMVIGWFAREEQAKRNLRRLQMRTFNYMKEIADKAVVLQITEQNGDIFAHNKETGLFVSQAKSMEDLIKDLSTRFPNTTFIAERSTLESVGFKHETL